MSNYQLICPSCGSNYIVKNGTIHNKKQKYQCQNSL
ncbi:IS1/IS1595 family N-terminal zinc-binding domain-containing protein [Okeania hirsuta]